MNKATERMIKRHKATVPKFDDNGIVHILPRMMVTPYFDLRGDKLSVMRNTPLCTDYMLFLNGRCTLGHIVHAMDVDDPDYADGVPHRRQPIPHRLRGAHPEYIRRWVLQKLIDRGMI